MTLGFSNGSDFQEDSNDDYGKASHPCAHTSASVNSFRLERNDDAKVRPS